LSFCQQCQNSNYEACINKHVVGEWTDHSLLLGEKGKRTDGKRPPRGTASSSRISKRKETKCDESKETPVKKKVSTEHKKDINGKGKRHQGKTETAHNIRKSPSEQRKANNATAAKKKNARHALNDIKLQLDRELTGPLPETEDLSFVSTSKCVHKESIDLVPDDLPLDSEFQLYPAEIFGDGNCLPRCGSFLAYMVMKTNI